MEISPVHKNSSEVKYTNLYEKINWEDYNYPKYLKLVHFSLDEIDDIDLKKLVIKIRVVFILITIVLFVNIVDSIINSTKYISPIITIIYSFLNSVIFTSLSFFIFFLGYQSLLLNRLQIKLIYLILQISSSILWLCFSIIDLGAFNGILRQIHLANVNGIAAIFCILLGIVESLIYIAAFVLGLYCSLAVYMYKHPKVAENIIYVNVNSQNNQII